MVCGRSHKFYVFFIELEDKFSNVFGLFYIAISAQYKKKQKKRVIKNLN